MGPRMRELADGASQPGSVVNSPLSFRRER